LDALCHAIFANHHCWSDALALIMQTGYEVSSLFVPVISRVSNWAVCYKNHLVLLVIDYTFKEFLYVQGVALPLLANRLSRRLAICHEDDVCRL